MEVRVGTPYRYWRARIVGRGLAGAAARVYSLEMRETADTSGTNVATATYGSYSATGTGSNTWTSLASAFDSNAGTYAGISLSPSDALDPTLILDFGAGAARDIQSFGWTWYCPSGYAYSVMLEGSDDGAGWVLRAFIPTLWSNTNTGYAAAAFPISGASGVPPLAAIQGAERPSAASRLSLSPHRFDLEDGGQYRIVGTVKVKGSPNVPVHRRVVLINERSRRIVRETWSDPVTGAYAFEGIRGDVAYTTLAYDYTGNYRGVLADNLTAERMP